MSVDEEKLRLDITSILDAGVKYVEVKPPPRNVFDGLDDDVVLSSYDISAIVAVTRRTVSLWHAAGHLPKPRFRRRCGAQIWLVEDLRGWTPPKLPRGRKKKES